MHKSHIQPNRLSRTEHWYNCIQVLFNVLDYHQINENKSPVKILAIHQIYYYRYSIIIIIISKGRQCKAGTDRLTPYQSEDPNPTTPTHRMKEEKGKTAGDKK